MGKEIFEWAQRPERPMMSLEVLGAGKDQEPLKWMGSKDGQIGLRAPWICHQHQRALWFILQAVGNRKEFKPILSYIPSLDNLTEAV